MPCSSAWWTTVWARRSSWPRASIASSCAAWPDASWQTSTSACLRSSPSSATARSTRTSATCGAGCTDRRRSARLEPPGELVEVAARDLLGADAAEPLEARLFLRRAHLAAGALRKSFHLLRALHGGAHVADDLGQVRGQVLRQALAPFERAPGAPAHFERVRQIALDLRQTLDVGGRTGQGSPHLGAGDLEDRDEAVQ